MIAARQGVGFAVPIGELTAPFTNGSAHPAKLDMFTDVGSFWHLVIGFLAGMAGGSLEVAALAAFSGYQVSQVASGAGWTRTGGELVEFALGVFAAKAVQMRGGL